MGKPPKPQPTPNPPPMTILKRRSIAPVNLTAGSTFTQETIPGTILQLIDVTDAQAMIANEAVLFEMLFEGRRAIGGFILEQ